MRRIQFIGKTQRALRCFLHQIGSSILRPSRNVRAFLLSCSTRDVEKFLWTCSRTIGSAEISVYRRYTSSNIAIILLRCALRRAKKMWYILPCHFDGLLQKILITNIFQVIQKKTTDLTTRPIIFEILIWYLIQFVACLGLRVFDNVARYSDNFVIYWKIQRIVRWHFILLLLNDILRIGRVINNENTTRTNEWYHIMLYIKGNARANLSRYTVTIMGWVTTVRGRVKEEGRALWCSKPEKYWKIVERTPLHGPGLCSV